MVSTMERRLTVWSVERRQAEREKIQRRQARRAELKAVAQAAAPRRHQHWDDRRTAQQVAEGIVRKDAQRFAKYGLMPADVEAMRSAQNNQCPICDRPLTDVYTIDHCHAEGYVRGLLCHRCNSGLGMFEDNPELFARAVDYLERSRRKER